MNDNTKVALLQSIQHWCDNVDASIVVKDPDTFDDYMFAESTYDDSGNACALCNHHRNYSGYTMCNKCPVMEKTGEWGCLGTPWARTSVNEAGANIEMLEFLIELLPKE